MMARLRHAAWEWAMAWTSRSCCPVNGSPLIFAHTNPQQQHDQQDPATHQQAKAEQPTIGSSRQPMQCYHRECTVARHVNPFPGAMSDPSLDLKAERHDQE